MRTELFGAKGTHLCNILDNIVPQLRGTTIDWSEPAFDILLKEKPNEAHKQLWIEILGRAYIAAAASLSRGSLWVKGMEESYRCSNYQSFAASLRGLIESAADSMYSLESVALTLAENYKDISNVLHGQTLDSKFIVIPKLEEQLIHFAYAKKPSKNENVPKGHHVLHTRQYIDVLKKFSPKLENLYKNLCTVVHPESASVQWMMSTEENIPWTINFIGLDNSASLIVSTIDSYETELLDLLMVITNYSLLTLKVLSYFNVKEFQVDFMKKYDLSDLPAWGKIRRNLKQELTN